MTADVVEEKLVKVSQHGGREAVSQGAGKRASKGGIVAATIAADPNSRFEKGIQRFGVETVRGCAIVWVS